MALNYEYSCDRPGCKCVQKTGLSYQAFPPGWGQLNLSLRDAANEHFEARVDLCPEDLKAAIEQFCGNKRWYANQLKTKSKPNLRFKKATR